MTHQGSIAIHFANFLKQGWQDNRLDGQLEDFKTVSKPDNVIFHKNEHVNADIKEIEIDLSKLDTEALHAMYETINTCPDTTIKETLLIQFKQERPYFSLEMNAKQLLQDVAYGEQDKADELLQKNSELAQILLQKEGIPFTAFQGEPSTVRPTNTLIGLKTRICSVC